MSEPVSSGPHVVMIVGDLVQGGLTRSLAGGFRDVGWAVHLVPWGTGIPRPFGSVAMRVPSLVEPLRRGLVRLIRQRARSSSFRMSIVVKGQFLDARTIGHMRQVLSAPVVCWNPDSPFDEALSNRGGGIPAAIGAYDAYVTWADDVADRLRDVSDRVFVVPFGFDPRLHFPATGNGSLAERIVFIGSWTHEREAWLSSIGSWRPVVFGNHWPPVPGLDVRPAVSGERFRSVVGEARWNLNFLRPQNALSHNMRTFEIPACGGRQLANASPDHRRFLAGSAARLFDDLEQLVAHLAAEPPSGPARPDDFDRHSYAARADAFLQQLAQT